MKAVSNGWRLAFAFLVLATPVALTSCASKPAAPAAPVAVAPKIIDWNRFSSAVILRTYRGKHIYLCSAVMISKRTGLTTAHCIAHSDKNQVLVGMSPTDPALQTVSVLQKSIRIHPGYQPEKSLSDSDLALFRLKTDAQVATFPQLPEPTDPPLAAGQSLDRVSFGLRNGLNGRTWTEVFLEKVDGHRLLVKDALSVTGDSGGPIFDTRSSSPKLVGIHSTLLQPSQIAAVNLAEFKSWILQNSDSL